MVSGNVTVAAISNDNVNVASYLNSQRQPDGAFIGILQVSPIAGGAPTMIDTLASGATYARGTTLYYLANASQVSEGTPPVAHTFGTLKALVPGQTALIVLSTNIVEAFSNSEDGSAVAFIDRASASEDATGPVKVWSTTLCTTTTCAAPLVVGDGVASATLDLSQHGDEVAIGVPKVDTTPGSVVLVSFPSGTMTTLSPTTGGHSAMLSFDGSTVAWINPPNLLMVAPTANPSAATMTAIVSPTLATPVVSSGAMVTSSTFVLELKASSTATDTELDLYDGTNVTSLSITDPIRFAVDQRTPGDTTASSRWLFYVMADNADGTENLWIQDLQNPTTPPTSLAESTSGNPTFSDDGSTLRLLNNIDLTTNLGDLDVVTLPDVASMTVTTGIRGAQFEVGSTKLIYINSPDPTTGAGELTLYQPSPLGPMPASIPGVANVVQSRTQSIMYYTQDSRPSHRRHLRRVPALNHSVI